MSMDPNEGTFVLHCEVTKVFVRYPNQGQCCKEENS
ncbi:hypothetical protein SOVF_122940 isoform B, partial [Spinacia oleracea]